jgi:hypothetical protein
VLNRARGIVKKSLVSPAVVTKGPKGEPYSDFQKRVAEDAKRVKAKCDSLDKFTPRCTHCGETCDPINAGKACKANGCPMVSRWAEERAPRDWYTLGFFDGSWHSSEEALASLLDRVRAGEV